jgi:subtilisin-like proprotein convertase family protein
MRETSKLARVAGAATLAGLVACFALVLPAGAAKKSAFVTKTKVASSGNLALGIIDPQAPGNETNDNVTRSSIKPGGIRNRARIKDVNVSVRLDHGSDRDVNLYLASPKGVIRLSTDNGDVGDDYGTGADDCSGTPTVFDSQAPGLVTAGIAPFNGSYRPEESLVPLQGITGKVAKQRWTLIAVDDNGGAFGTLFCWKLRFRVRTRV